MIMLDPRVIAMNIADTTQSACRMRKRRTSRAFSLVIIGVVMALTYFGARMV